MRIVTRAILGEIYVRKLFNLFAAVALCGAAALGFTVSESAAQSAGYVISAVDLEIKPEHLDKFIEAAKENGAATIKEPGCRQYDIVQSATNPTQILLYEVYVDQAAVAAHRASEHFKKYVAVTGDMVAKRQSRPMKPIALQAKPQ